MRRTLALIAAVGILASSAVPVYSEDITLNPEVRVPELVAAPLGLEGAKEIPAHPKGVEVAQNARFSDIGAAKEKSSILRLAAEGVVKGSGGRFRPGDPITRQEALAYLVRLRGSEAAVQERLSTNAGNSQANYGSSLFQEYTNEAVTLGILTAEENSALEAPATRQQLAVWVARAVNLTAEYGNQSILNSLSDNGTAAPANRGLLEALLVQRLLEPDAGGKLNPGRTVPRTEAARMLALASERLQEPRGLASSYGVVSGISTTPRYEGGATVTETLYTVRGIDGTVSQVKAAVNSKTKQRSDFAVLKNGSVGTSGALALGDQVELLLEADQLLLAQVYTDGTVLNRLKADALKDQALTTYYGTVSSVIQENRQINGRSLKTDRLRVKNHTGQTFDIVVDTDAQTGVRQDVIVQRAGVMGGVSMLQPGDGLEYAVKEPNILLYVNASAASASQAKGTVRAVEPSGAEGLAYVTILDYGNTIARYPVAGYADITTNGEYSRLSDLRYGQNIVLTLNNGLVTGAAAETFSSPGYIAPESKMRMGTLLSINGVNGVMKGDDGLQTVLLLTETTVIRKNSQQVGRSALQPGDRIKAYFNEVDSQTPSRIDIEGKEQLIKGVYKGKLQQVNGAKNELVLREPQMLKNNQWVATGNYTQSVEMEPGASIYHAGSTVALSRLKPTHINADVYVAIKDGYGRDLGVKGLIKTGSERIHSDRIGTLSQGIQRMELDNRINYNFNDGTIVVRENRLVGLGALAEKDTALVVSGYSGGAHTAGIISLVPGASSSLQNIYIGTLEQIFSGQFILKNYFERNGNGFRSLNTQNELTIGYGNDTQIIDVTGDAVKVLTPSQLFNGGYSKEENKDSNSKGLPYEHWYAVIVTDENQEAHSIMLRKKAILENQDIDDTYSSYNEQRTAMEKVINQVTFTRGTVVSLDTVWNRVRLENSADYGTFNNQWITNPTDTYVAAADTIILKNNRPIAFTDLEAGDRITAVRVKAAALVLIVEN